MNKIILCLLLVLAGWSIATALPETKKQSRLKETTLLQFKNDAKAFADATLILKNNLNLIEDDDTNAVVRAIAALKETRMAYKKIEFFVEYFFTYPINLYNRAPVYEIEEPYMEFQAPVGLQVIESLLLEPRPFQHKKALLEQAEVIHSTAADIPSVIYGLELSDDLIAEALRLELIRIMTLGITGYDAPQLKTGITESAVAWTAIKTALLPVLELHHTPASDSVLRYLDEGIKLLHTELPFDRFDRMEFLTAAALPLQSQLSTLFMELDWNAPNPSLLNKQAKNLFSPDAFKNDSFLTHPSDTGKAIVTLGKALFFEPLLSGNGQRSCATCHKPEQYFTDALPKSIAFNGKENLPRNAPGLLYASLQHGQFLDARSASLEEQIVAVLSNPQEMNADLLAVADKIDTKHYRRLFRKAFSYARRDSVVTISKMARAIAAFERTLAPFNAPFDRYVQGEEKAMSPAQINGFNLFMGKAQCGTCHFAPLFNGLLPPLYTVTELEVLGVPGNENLTTPLYDSDEGRYAVFKIKFYKGAFKTPTVRNASMTAPYMHNGAFKTMEQVVEFYNKGGGLGIGLDIPSQTLSANPLQLTKEEVRDIVLFIESLKDDLTHL